MKTREEKRWELMQEVLFAESRGDKPLRVSSQRTLFGIKSHVETVIDAVAEEDRKKCEELIKSQKNNANAPAPDGEPAADTAADEHISDGPTDVQIAGKAADGHNADAPAPDGEQADGRATASEPTAGKAADGHNADAPAPDGEPADERATADELADAPAPDGEPAADTAADEHISDGSTDVQIADKAADGHNADAPAPDGEPAADGHNADAPAPDGEPAADEHNADGQVPADEPAADKSLQANEPENKQANN